MQSFVRGQRAKLSVFSTGKKFEVKISLRSARVKVFDFVCFGVDERAQLSDDRFMVFFNQKNSPEDAIQLLELSDQNARFSVDVDKVPASVARLVFTASVEGVGAMRDLQSGSFTLREGNTLLESSDDVINRVVLGLLEGSAPLLEYRFQGADFKDEGALMLAELYRKDGEWRVWAQGQGFAGDLGALLTHFGGTQIEEEPRPVGSPTSVENPLPSPIESPLQPPLVPLPPASSVSLPRPSAPARAGSLQEKIAQTPSGGTLSLAPGEYQGPIFLDQPITIDGNGAAVWAHNGPVVIVGSARVSIKNLDIEATAPDALVADSNVALQVQHGTQPKLDNVKTRGEIEGVPGVSGAWKLPLSLDLGEFAPRGLNSFSVRVEVPNACELQTPVAGVSFHPARLERGANELEIRVENVGADIFLAGLVEFRIAGVARTVPLSGRTARSPIDAVRGRVLTSN